ncbi:putative ribonuclease H-like domain-containing protein [Tanacetum coccineum]
MRMAIASCSNWEYEMWEIRMQHQDFSDPGIMLLWEVIVNGILGLKLMLEGMIYAQHKEDSQEGMLKAQLVQVVLIVLILCPEVSTAYQPESCVTASTELRVLSTSCDEFEEMDLKVELALPKLLCLKKKDVVTAHNECPNCGITLRIWRLERLKQEKEGFEFKIGKEEPKKAREKYDAPLLKIGYQMMRDEVGAYHLRSVNTDRPFSTARSFNIVRPPYTAHPNHLSHYADLSTYFQNQAQSTVYRPFYKRTTLTKRSYYQRFNTGRQNVNTVRERGFNAVKSSNMLVWRPINLKGASTWLFTNIITLSNSQLNDKSLLIVGILSRRITGIGDYLHKEYCLVVTDDYSRFSWVFFLSTKDETTEILKISFIKDSRQILVDKESKIITSDNGTEFRNKVMDDFRGKKVFHAKLLRLSMRYYFSVRYSIDKSGASLMEDLCDERSSVVGDIP